MLLCLTVVEPFHVTEISLQQHSESLRLMAAVVILKSTPTTALQLPWTIRLTCYPHSVHNIPKEQL